jgi:hypothetical protein
MCNVGVVADDWEGDKSHILRSDRSYENLGKFHKNVWVLLERICSFPLDNAYCDVCAKKRHKFHTPGIFDDFFALYNKKRVGCLSFIIEILRDDVKLGMECLIEIVRLICSRLLWLPVSGGGAGPRSIRHYWVRKVCKAAWTSIWKFWILPILRNLLRCIIISLIFWHAISGLLKLCLTSTQIVIGMVDMDIFEMRLLRFLRIVSSCKGILTRCLNVLQNISLEVHKSTRAHRFASIWLANYWY